MQKLCVKWGSTNTGCHINVDYANFTHTLSVKLKHTGIWGWEFMA